MTIIANTVTDERTRAKWRAEAARIAAELKGIPDWGDRTSIKAGIVFDDQLVTVELETALIQRLPEAELADALFDGVVKTQESVVQPPARSAPVPQVSETCWRRKPPEFTENCTNHATGGIALTLHAALHLQKRYGKRPLLRLLLDLPVCDGCFKQMTALEVIARGLQQGQWGAISKVAQQRNNGVLPIREQSEIAHEPFDSPEYVELRKHIAKAQAAPEAPKPADAANDGVAGE